MAIEALLFAGAPYQTGVPRDPANYFLIANVWGRVIQVHIRFHGPCPGAPSFASPVLCELQVEGAAWRG